MLSKGSAFIDIRGKLLGHASEGRGVFLWQARGEAGLEQ